MTQMLAQREHDYFAETVICANCYIVAKIFSPCGFFFSPRAFFVFVQLLLSPSRLVMGPQCAFFSSAGGEKMACVIFFA